MPVVLSMQVRTLASKLALPYDPDGPASLRVRRLLLSRKRYRLVGYLLARLYVERNHCPSAAQGPHLVLLLLAIMAILPFAGCTSAPVEAGFSDINDVAAERTGYATALTRAEEDARVNATVAELFSDELTLEEAIKIGLLNNRNLQAMFEQLGISLGQLVTDEDPGRLSDYLESEVGHRPAMLCTGSGLDLCGCCVREFRGKPVASYVVKWKGTPVSVVAVPRSPAALGMVPAKGKTAASRDLWQARHGCCNLASVRVGEYSYCAIGQVTQDELVAVLGTLLE